MSTELDKLNMKCKCVSSQRHSPCRWGAALPAVPGPVPHSASPLACSALLPSCSDSLPVTPGNELFPEGHRSDVYEGRHTVVWLLYADFCIFVFIMLSSTDYHLSECYFPLIHYYIFSQPSYCQSQKAMFLIQCCLKSNNFINYVLKYCSLWLLL